MTFHFQKAELTDRAVRRVCLDHVGEALKRLRQSRHPAAVHGVRKEIKKLRAILRLVRGQIGPGAYRRTARRLRQVADRLAAPRDARVTLQAFEKLAGPKAARQFRKIHQALRKNCRQETRRFRGDNSVRVAKQILRKICRRVADLKIKSAGWLAIEPGLRQSYRRGRLAYQLARRQRSAENFHRWRKHVKDLWHHLRLLCPAWPEPARAMLHDLEQLGELLGNDHDLVLLRQFVAERCKEQASAVAGLNQLIEARQKKLRAAALKLGAKLYAEKPVKVGAQLGKLWIAWRGTPDTH